MRNRKIADVIKGQTLIFADTKLSIREAAKKMSAAGVGAILVVTGEKLVGIFTERDALKRVLAAGTQPDNVRLDEVMTPSPMMGKVLFLSPAPICLVCAVSAP